MHNRILTDLAFKLDAEGQVCDPKTGEASPEAQRAHDVLILALSAAKRYAVDVTEMEPTTKATLHICRHDTKEGCIEEEEIRPGARCVEAVPGSLEIVPWGRVER